MSNNASTAVADTVKLQSKREADLGITHYVDTSAPGFKGTLKQRFTDFQVYEIGTDGKIVTLCDGESFDSGELKKEKEIKEEVKEEVKEEQQEVEAVTMVHQAADVSGPGVALSPVIVLGPETEEKLIEWFGEEKKDALVAMYQSAISSPHLRPAAHGRIESKPIHRDSRLAIHNCIRQIFEQRLDSVGNNDGIITVTVLPTGSNRQRKNGPPREATRVFIEKGEYLYLSMYKENKDTTEATSFIAKMLKIKPQSIGHAGTKDRRAATTQRVSIPRGIEERVHQINRLLRGVYLSNFSYHKQGLELGELSGNRFVITLRDVDFDFTDDIDIETRKKIADEFLESRVKCFIANGFINYFGLQRFGTHGIGTDAVGLLILQGDFEGAVAAILTFDPKILMKSEEFETRDKINRDDVDRAMAISEFRRTGSAKYANSNMPRRFGAESTIINHLSRNGKDFVGALLRINRNTRTMYVHAYQSLVWNAAASERYKQHGAKVIKGDLILVDTQAEKVALRDEVDENGEVVIHPAADDTAVNPDDIFQRARPLTAEEAESGKYTIFDIVLPTPGFDVNYPDNDIGDYYKKFMSSERGGGLDPGNMRRAQRDFSLSGSYRPLMGKVSQDMTFETRIYHGMNTQLVETDLDNLRKAKPGVVEKIQPTQVPNAPNQQNRAPRRAPQSAAQAAALSNDIAVARAKLANSSAMAGWAMASSTIVASDKALAKANKEEFDRAKAEGRIVAPTYKDTFRATSEDSCKATGEAIVEIIKGEDVPKSIKSEDVPNLAALQTTPIVANVTQAQASPIPAIPASEPANNKRGAAEISTSTPPSPRSWDGTPEPARLAVILTFSLGTSQYATMALRELMRSDGVRSFQTEYHTKR